MGEPLPPGPESAVLQGAFWLMSPSFACWPVSDLVKAAVLALPTGSGRARREHEWRVLARFPCFPFPAHTRLCISSFPRHRSRVLGRVIVLRSALRQNCLQEEGACKPGESKDKTWTLGATSLRADLPPPTPRQPS